MGNTSATGGYIQPEYEEIPFTDESLDSVFQKAIVGITGLEGSLVRPNWQKESIPVPPRDTNWCALSVDIIKNDDSPAFVHVSEGDGKDLHIRHQDILVTATFYGWDGMRYAAKMQDGLTIPQNQEQIKASGFAFISNEPVRSVPELFNQQWVKRYDLRMNYRRKVTRLYPILNIVAAEVDVYKDNGRPVDIIIIKE